MLSSIISQAILGSLRPAGIPGVGRWIGAYLMASVALLLAGLQRPGFLILTVFVSNTLLARADAARHVARSRGRNRVVAI